MKTKPTGGRNYEPLRRPPLKKPGTRQVSVHYAGSGTTDRNITAVVTVPLAPWEKPRAPETTIAE